MSDYYKEQLFDFTNILFLDIHKSISTVLDEIVFIDSKIFKEGTVRKLLGSSNDFGIIKLAYTFIYGILIYFIFKFLLSKITNEEEEGIGGFLYKLLIAALVIGFSFEISKYIIEINSYISEAILNLGKEISQRNVSFKELFNKINIIILDSSNKDSETINSILKAFVSFGLINLVLVYSLRYIYIKILCLMMPIAIILKTNKKTEYISKAWIKSFLGLLFLQHLIACVIVIAINIKFGRISLLSKVISVGCVYALMQINELQREIIGGTSLYINNSFRMQKGGI